MKTTKDRKINDKKHDQINIKSSNTPKKDSNKKVLSNQNNDQEQLNRKQDFKPRDNA